MSQAQQAHVQGLVAVGCIYIATACDRQTKKVVGFITIAHPSYLILTSTFRPLINRKLEEKDCGEGPNLENIFEDDIHMNEIQEKIIVITLTK